MTFSTTLHSECDVFSISGYGGEEDLTVTAPTVVHGGSSNGCLGERRREKGKGRERNKKYSV